MSEHDISNLGLEPDDLDGHTIDELMAYLDTGRTPIDPSIERSPGCRIALGALERLRALTPQLLEADIAADSATDEGWVRGILDSIALDSRAGRRIPIESPKPSADLGITEGAVRGLIRGSEDRVPGVLVGRTHLHGDVTVTGEPIRVRTEVSVPYGVPILDLVAPLRAEIQSRLAAHTNLVVAGIDITVTDVTPLLGADR